MNMKPTINNEIVGIYQSISKYNCQSEIKKLNLLRSTCIDMIRQHLRPIYFEHILNYLKKNPIVVDERSIQIAMTRIIRYIII